MTVEPETDDELVAVGTAAVCADPDAIREALLDTFAESGPLDHALRVIGARRDATDEAVVAALDALHEALQATSDARGLYGRLRAAGTGLRPAGMATAGPAGAAYYCPDGRCARFWLPDGPGEIPRCSLSSALLRRKPH